MNKTILLLISIFLTCAGCKKDDTPSPNELPPPGTLEFMDNVIQLDTVANNAVASLNSTSLYFNGFQGNVQNIKTGDIIIGAPSAVAPNGFLRRVTAVNPDGTVLTESVTLDQAIKKCNIKETIVIDDWFRSPEIEVNVNQTIYDGDNDPNTAGDQIRIEAGTKIKPSFIFELQKAEGLTLSIDYAKVGLGLDGNFYGKVTATGGVSVSKEIPVDSLKGKPVVLYGIWITPSWVLSVGAEGSLKGQASFGGKNNFTISAYREYKDDVLQPLSFTRTTTGLNPYLDLSAEAELEGYLKSKAELKIFETVGISASEKAYLRAEASINPSAPTELQYCFKYGFKCGVGVEAAVFGTKIGGAGVEVTIFQDTFPSFGTFKSCGTIPSNPGGSSSVTDIDGNIYPTVTIGTQVWMRENLKVRRYRNGDPIQELQDKINWVNLTTGAFCHYDNNPAYENIYGKFYNWYAAVDPRQICPQGWHVPSDAEWTVLSDYLGGEEVAGVKMKAITLWPAWPSPLTNNSGFSALPSGVLDGYFPTGGVFLNINSETNFWTTTGASGNNAWSRRIANNQDKLIRWTSFYPKPSGMCIRCLKD